MKTIRIRKQLRHKMKTIRSKKHQLGSYEINKVSLSCFDDKRYIHDNGITSYADGHYRIGERVHQSQLVKPIESNKQPQLSEPIESTKQP